VLGVKIECWEAWEGFLLCAGALNRKSQQANRETVKFEVDSKQERTHKTEENTHGLKVANSFRMMTCELKQTKKITGNRK
jgi:hypothetical protein